MRGRAKRSRFNEKLKVTSQYRVCGPIITEGKMQEMKDLQQGVEEYRELVKKKYSIEITQGEAEEQFSELLALF